MDIKFLKPAVWAGVITLVGGEVVEVMHLKELQRHVDTEKHEPFDAGRFRTQYVVTSEGFTGPASGFVYRV